MKNYATALALTVTLFACQKTDDRLIPQTGAPATTAPATVAPATTEPAKADASAAPAADAAAQPAADTAAPAPVATPLGPGQLARPLTERREVTASFVWFAGEPGPSATGGASPMTVRVEPNAKHIPSVGVLEEYAGGLGPMWRSASWMAAINASNTVGLSLTDHEFIVRASGHVDGPSAGMLTTATMVAAIMGVPVRGDTIMTGTVNPDGSAGPVGGIPQKMAGAKEKGFTRFGYPLGGRMSQDMKTGQMVDLDVVGRDLGMETREIDDVFEAYEFLTGQKLPELPEASESDLELDPDLRTQVNAKVLAWKSLIDAEAPALEAKLQQMSPQLKAFIDPHIAEVNKAIQACQNHEKNGLFVAAYDKAVFAVVRLKIAIELMKFIEAAARQDFAAIDQQIAGLQSVGGRVKALGMELSVAARKKTVGGIVNTVGGFANFLATNAFLEHGDEGYQIAVNIVKGIQSGQIPRTDQAIGAAIDQLSKPIVFYTAADAMIQASRELIELSREEGSTVEVDLGRLGEIAKGYASAAGAGLAYFETIFVEPQAKAANMTKEAAVAVFQGREADYLLAPTLVRFAESADALFGADKPEAALARLGAGAMAYIQMGSLVNKYYSLGATPQPDGSIAIENRRALTAQLGLAKRSALQCAALAKTVVGFVPVMAKFAYEEAGAGREGDDSEKIGALSSYWASAFWSRLAVNLAR